MSLQKDCPLCKAIEAGDVLEEGDYCCKLKRGSSTIVSAKEHTPETCGESLREAVKLLGFENEKGFIIASYDSVPGHWALILVPTGIPIGKSISKDKK